MCYITATQLKSNLGYYLELSQNEDIFVTKNNKIITVLTNPKDKAYDKFFKLREKLNPNNKDVDYDALFKEAMMKKCGF